MTFPIRLHHAAYRCNDAKETVDFYRDILGMKYAQAFSEKAPPSGAGKGPLRPYMHVIMETSAGEYLAFFEMPEEEPMVPISETTHSSQHIAFEVACETALNQAIEKLKEAGVEVRGPVDHSFCQSIYFRDPNGHQIELVHRTDTPEMNRRMEESVESMLKAWDETKEVQTHTHWAHAKALGETDHN